MADISAQLIPLDDKIYKHFTAFTEAFLIGEKQFCYPKFGPQILQKLQTFQANDDDVCVVTFPKTGTTWSQAIVTLLMMDVDLDKVQNFNVDAKFPYVDIGVWEHLPLILENLYETAIALPKPRLLKMHVHLSLLPPEIAAKKCKIVYVSRNVKDTIISFYHFMSSLCASSFVGSLEDFAHLFMANRVPYTPYITHVKEAWEKRHEENIYFTTYEDMKKDSKKVIGEIAQFLDRKVTKEQIKVVDEYCKFDNMKNNPSYNRENWGDTGFIIKEDFEFFRKGMVGGWKSAMSPELSAKINKWVFDNTNDCPELRDIL